MESIKKVAFAAARAGSVVNRYVFKPIANRRARRVAIEELMSLDDHMLADIGITRGDIPGIIAGKIDPRGAANEDLQQRVA